MSEDNDIQSEMFEIPDLNDDDPRAIAYRIAAYVMDEYRPGFVLIGSPHMGETGAGFMYPESIGIVINNDVDLTPTGLASILGELSSQLNAKVDEIENYVEDSNDTE